MRRKYKVKRKIWKIKKNREKNLKDSTVVEYEDKLYKVQNKKKILENKTEEIDIASEKPNDPTVLVDEEKVQSKRKDVEDETEKIVPTVVEDGVLLA